MITLEQLTAARVAELRRMVESREMPQRAIACAFGVSQALVSMVAAGKRRSERAW